MKLLTKELINKIPELYSTDGQEEKTVVCKFFHPMSNYTWYVIEGQPIQNEVGDDDYEFFGYVDGHEGELGYFTLKELQSVKVYGLGVERDLYFKPCKLSEVTR